jgi:hypothetical protein
LASIKTVIGLMKGGKAGGWHLTASAELTKVVKEVNDDE